MRSPIHVSHGPQSQQAIDSIRSEGRANLEFHAAHQWLSKENRYQRRTGGAGLPRWRYLNDALDAPCNAMRSLVCAGAQILYSRPGQFRVAGSMRPEWNRAAKLSPYSGVPYWLAGGPCSTWPNQYRRVFDTLRSIGLRGCEAFARARSGRSTLRQQAHARPRAGSRASDAEQRASLSSAFAAKRSRNSACRSAADAYTQTATCRRARGGAL